MRTDTSRDELLPCPFCGSENINTENARDFVSCRGCGTEGPCRQGQGSTSAIEAWNRRSSDRASIRAGKLPELPPGRRGSYTGINEVLYTADQMREYALAALGATKEGQP